MPQRELELILMKQLASYLAMPILLLDAKGDLLFFNEPAEAILGRRFEETGEIRRGEFTALFRPTDDKGSPLKSEELPLSIARDQNRPAHLEHWLQGMDGIRRKIEGTAFPLIGQGGRKVGTVGIFWELEQS